MGENDTIVGLATGRRSAALAVLRISGKEAFEMLERVMLPLKRFQAAPPRKISLYRFFDPDKQCIIDEITAVKYSSPQSYTGENMVEIICHGGEIVVEGILSCLLKNGVRHAKRGEFTRRAFLNGKMDLLKAEAVREIIESKSARHYAIAMGMYTGNTAREKLFEWKDVLKGVLAEIEAGIDFPEEDDIENRKSGYAHALMNLHRDIAKELSIRKKIKRVENGLKIPIVGVANAGKSSLLNMIVGYDRAIVHHEKGTTRDAISEEVVLGGEKATIIDTAGLNDTGNDVERMGIKKSWEHIQSGDLIIWVSAADREIEEVEKRILNEITIGKPIGIISKSDLCDGNKKRSFLNDKGIPCLEVCLINQEEREQVLEFIGEQVGEMAGLEQKETGIIATGRQEEIISRMERAIGEINKNYLNAGEEIISHVIKNVLQDMAELVGETCTEEVLDTVFSRFCIGK